MTLPGWLEPLYDADAMRATDRWAIEECGIPSLELMDRAGRGLAEAAERAARGRGPIVVVCGKGNNGGDGLVAARLLRDGGHEVRVALLGDPSELRGDAAANLERLPGEPPQHFDASVLAGAASVVDAILGTGFDGEPREPARGAIKAINACVAPVVAADVPSGVDASTGEVHGAAVRAEATATFAAAKPGLWIAPGKRHAGTVEVIDIGIPPDGPSRPSAGLITPAVLDGLPRRGQESTKFASGHVLVCGGSRGLTGAPSMAAESAMRAGAGYVTACVPASLELVFEIRLLEVMTRGLPDADGALIAAGADTVIELTGRGGVLVLGPGIGRSGDATALARDLARRAEVALVLDADGLNAHAGRLEDLAARSAPTILTPHAGELGRLLGVPSDAVEARRLHHARDAAQRARAIVVLKGDDTIVAAPGGVVAVNRGGSSALATAGTGDVLSGVVGAMLARGMEPFAAAAAAVHVHSLAGRRAAEDHGGVEGVIAGDVVAALPFVLGG